MRRSLAALVAGSVVTAVVACAGPSADRPAADRSASSTTARCRSTDAAPDGARRTVTVDGAERSYLLRTPAATSEPVPLVIGLHGFGGSATELESHAALAARGAAAGSVVVLPDAEGEPARWNFDRRPSGPDDFAFLDALVGRVEHDHCIDRRRVSIVGSSNGAAFAGLAACDQPGRFAAVAMVIATVPTVCPGPSTPSVLTIRGTADQHVPFAGVTDLVAHDAGRAACQRGPVADRPVPDVERTRYAECRGGAEIVLDAVEGGGHRWPTADGASGYDATGAVLAFFSR